MGYTHYWTHKRRFTNAQFASVITNIQAILFAAKDSGIQLGDACGETELAPVESVVQEYDDGREILFNGLGGEAHETFNIYPNRRPLDSWQKKSQRGFDFCKTARKPYDVAVTACLCYLESTYPDQFSVDSDGFPKDWQAGLELARQALPRLDNVLRIPRSVEFDAMFARRHFGCGKHALAILRDGTPCIIDDKAFAIVGRFETKEGADWALGWLERIKESRQKLLPARCDYLERWEARKMREFVNAASSFGYTQTGESI